MSGNLGNATLSLDVNDSRLIGGLNKALALVKAMGAQMATAYGQSGTTAGQAFGNNVQIVIQKAASGLGSTGQQAGKAYIGGMNTAIQGGGSKISGGVNTVLQPTIGSASAAGLKAGAAMAASMAKGLGSGAGAIVNAGHSIGKEIRNTFKDVGRAVGVSIAYGIAGAMTGAVGGALSTKNIEEADKAARKVATLLAKNDRIAGQQSYKAEAQAISKRLRYGVGSADIQAGQYQALSSGFSRKEDINPMIENAAKLSIISNGDAALKDTTAALAALSNILKQSGFDGKNQQPLNLKRDGGRVGSLVSGFVDASVGFDEALTSRQIGKIVAPGARAKLDTYEILGVAAQASKTLTPGNVAAGVPQLFASIEKRSKPSASAAANLGYSQESGSINAFNGASLTSKGLIPFLDDLKKRLDSYEKINGTGKRNELFTKLFPNVQARRVAGAALDDLGGTREATGIIRGANIDDKLKISQQGLTAQKTAVANQFKELDIQFKQGAFADTLAKALGLVAQGLQAVAEFAGKVNAAYMALTPAQQEMAKTAGAIGLVLGGVVIALGAIGVAFGLLGGALAPVATAVGGFAVGLGKLAIAVAPIAAPFIIAGVAVYALAKALGESDTEAFRSAIIAVGGAIAAVFGGPAFTAMLVGLQKILIAAAPIAIPLLAAGAAVYGLSKAFGATDTEAFKNALIAVGIGLAAIFGPAAIKGMVIGTFALVKGFASVAIAAGAALIPMLPWIALAAGIAAAIYLLYKAFTGGIPIVNQWSRELQKQYNILGGRIILEFELMKLRVSGALNVLGQIVSGITKGIISAFRYMTIGIFEDIAKFVGQTYIGQQATRMLGDTFGGLWKTATESFNGMVAGGKQMIDWFGKGFSDLVNQIKGVIDWFQKIPNSIPGMGGNQPKPNYNYMPPKRLGLNAGSQSSAGNEMLVAYANNGVVSDSPQGLMARNPGYTVSGGGKHHTGMGRRSQYRSEGDETYLYNAGGFRRLVKDFVLSIGGNTSVGVPSPAAGKARVGFDERGYGNFVEVLDELGRRIALVAHLSKASVSTGDMVKFGDTLGIQGYTGRTVPRGRGGTHVHAEMPPENWAPYMSGLRSGTFNQESSSGTGIGSGRTSKEITEERARLEIEDAKRDLQRREQRLNEIRSAGVDRQTYSRKGKPTGRSAVQRQSAFNKRVEAAQEAVRKAKKRLADAELRLENADNNVEKERQQREIEALKNKVDEINSRYASQVKLIEDTVSADPSKKDEGTRKKADLLIAQGRELTAIFPELEAMGAKYPDNATVKDLRAVVDAIIDKRVEARAANAEVARLPLADIDKKVAEAIAKNQADAKSLDFAASTGLITPDQNAAEKSKALSAMSSELDQLLPQLREMSSKFKDPETVARIRAVTSAIQDQRIEAERVAKELTSSQYKVLIDKTLAGADRQQQGIKNQRSLGNITDLEMEQQLLDLRLKTSDALDLLRPKLEALAAVQKDEGVKAAIEEQILAIKTYSAEAVRSSQEQAKAQLEATLAYQTTKGVADAVVESARGAFLNLGATIRDLGGMLDGLLNKIADIALGGLFDKFVKPGILGIFGLAHGTRGIGSIPNFANGVADALSRERAQSGKRPFLAALHEGEAVLSTLNGDSQLYNQMLRDGRWAMAKATPNYAYGTPSVARSAASGGTARIVVDRINQVDYVTLEQVQQIVAVESPLIVEGSMGSLDQKMRSPGQRKRWGI